MVLGDGAFGRWLSHVGEAFVNGISALIIGAQRGPFPSTFFFFFFLILENVAWVWHNCPRRLELEKPYVCTEPFPGNI